MSNNMRYWEALGKTDPGQTKTFKRAGGFSGTAIKPMWSNKRMTEQFGPCGIGWGMTSPIFTTEAAGTEILVFCTIGLWYVDAGTKMGPVYGVGGDRLLTQIFEKDRSGNKVRDEETGRFKTYPQTDDEAFKKAFTDALSNAMKFIGVGADVHMGLFDDSKYVQEVREEFEGKDKPPTPPKRISKKQRDAFIDVVGKQGITKDVIIAKLKEEGFASSGEVTEDKFWGLMQWVVEYAPET